ncbi:hypothetical protein [Micromonospora sp. HUAS LYJ1]|uniref:hypothetical protein n=1 Tax=Micromonospora sp. HUAS LYJ1 TaxID=3061626 RepID=UPI0026728805|nr:hypothetical protein [Micromonospora sp. HUAS LYJ1]WKU03517.1 hypothetical protein Q2K16_22050 [Micromonospora sp. HUAS LYJ1]
MRISGADACLLRHHTNAVCAVDNLVVKTAPEEFGLDCTRVVVAVVQWLSARQFPTVFLSPRLPQPLLVNGHAVTVWERLDPVQDEPVTAIELRTLLRELHALPAPPVILPRLQPIDNVHASVIKSAILSTEDRELLLKRLGSLTKRWSVMEFPLGASLIQSDPQTRNALRRFDRTPVLADWDGVALGPRERI